MVRYVINTETKEYISFAGKNYSKNKLWKIQSDLRRRGEQNYIIFEDKGKADEFLKPQRISSAHPTQQQIRDAYPKRASVISVQGESVKGKEITNTLLNLFTQRYKEFNQSGLPPRQTFEPDQRNLFRGEDNLLVTFGIISANVDYEQSEYAISQAYNVLDRLMINFSDHDPIIVQNNRFAKEEIIFQAKNMFLQRAETILRDERTEVGRFYIEYNIGGNTFVYKDSELRGRR